MDDELSLICLQLSFLLDTFAEINQNLLKIYFIHILSNFMYLVTFYQKTEL
jgi:hypothetical protein